MSTIITDPATLITGGLSGTGFASPLSLSTGSLTITIAPGSGILAGAADGVTGQALYSALKILWQNNSTYIKFPFPMTAITPEQFEFINGWVPADDVTRKSLRTCAWVERDTSNNILRTYAGIVSLGTLGGTDQPYYQQNSSSGAPINFTFEGPVNEPVSIKIVATVPSSSGVTFSTGTFTYTEHGFVNGDIVVLTTSGTVPTGLTSGNTYYIVSGAANTFKVSATLGGSAVTISDNGTGNQIFTKDSTTYMKLFTREYQKTYAASALSDIGVTTMTYNVYRFPLANAADINVSDSDSTVSTTTPFTNTDVYWVRDSTNSYVIYNVRGSFANTTVYAKSDVVMDTGTNRWFKCILGFTSVSTQPSSDATHWSSYEGERQLGTTYYPFTIIIDGDTTVGSTVSGAARLAQIYEKIQYELRQNSDIDASTHGPVDGKTASSLLTFVGSTLVTSTGVFIESLNSNDINNVQFFDSTGALRTFPFVAAGILSFNSNLVADGAAIYRMYFTTLPGSADFGTSTAVLVEDSTSTDISGTVSGLSTIAFSFDYDSNVQGGRTAATDANVTVVALGLSTGQYVTTTATITRSTGQNISVVSSLERNYVS